LPIISYEYVIFLFVIYLRVAIAGEQPCHLLRLETFKLAGVQLTFLFHLDCGVGYARKDAREEEKVAGDLPSPGGVF
jgi:hypothetical protein